MKIVTAVNAMLANPDKITNVIAGASASADEYFFIYNGKFKWSTFKSKTTESYSVVFYPNAETRIEDLASLSDGDFQALEIDLVKYSVKEIGTKEAMATFSELHRVVKEKVFGMDEVLSEIIKDLDPFA